MRVLVAAVCAAALLAGCGGEPSLEEAKRDFVADCMNGEDGQRALCQCLADELGKRKEFKQGKAYTDASEAVRDGRSPAPVVAALQTCSQQRPQPQS